MGIEDIFCEQLDKSLVIPFALDSESNMAMPEELEIFLAWRLLDNRRSSTPFSSFTQSMDSLVKAYYPIWVIPFGDKIALIDPVVRKPANIEYVENPSADMFIDRLQAGHSKRSVFRNMLMVHQNTFTTLRSSKIPSIQGLLKGPDTTAIMNNVGKLDGEVPFASAQELCIGESSYAIVADDVAKLTKVIKNYTDGLDQLNLAVSVLESESDHQIRELKSEIEGLQKEYTHEINGAKEILHQSINKLIRRRDAEVEIVASRFSEIKDILISDISNFKKVHASLVREGGYLTKMVKARIGVGQGSSSSILNKLLGDHPSRLELLEKEVEKIHDLTKIVENEKSQQLACIESLYDEMIKAKSKMASDLEIDLDIEVKKRLAELDELSIMQMELKEKIVLLIASIQSEFEKTDWLLPNSLKIKNASIIFLPIYIAFYPRQQRDRMFALCAPGSFSKSPPPVGRSFTLEDRFRSFSSNIKILVETSLPAKICQSKRIREKILRLAEKQDSLNSLVPKLMKGAELAHEKNWLSYTEFHSLMNTFKQSLIAKQVQSS